MSSEYRTLARREQQILDIVYARKRATAAEVMTDMTDPPGYSAVRTLLATLERKGCVRHERDGARFVYVPIVHPAKAARTALAHVIRTFFAGSRGRAATALLDVSASQFSTEELDEIEALIRRARKGGKS